MGYVPGTASPTAQSLTTGQDESVFFQSTHGQERQANVVRLRTRTTRPGVSLRDTDNSGTNVRVTRTAHVRSQ